MRALKGVFLLTNDAQQYSPLGLLFFFFFAFFGGQGLLLSLAKEWKKGAKEDLVVQLSSGKIHSHSICAEEPRLKRRPKGWSCCCCRLSTAASWRQLIATFFCQQKCTHLSFSTTRSSSSHRSFAYFMHPNVKNSLVGLLSGFTF